MNIYLGIFLIAFSTLTLEVTLARFFSAVMWYHLAFFAISTAMLGMTAGATTVYLKPRWFDKQNCMKTISISCQAYALVIPLMLVVLCVLFLTNKFTVLNVLAYFMVAVVCSLPFYFSGIAISALLTKSGYPIGKIYSTDLVGASLGCLFVLGMLELVDAPSLILMCGITGSVAAILLARGTGAKSVLRGGFIIAAVLSILVSANLISPYKIQPLYSKGQRIPLNFIDFDKWNSFSRIMVSKEYTDKPQYWGPSPVAPSEPINQRIMVIDGGAATTMRRYHSREDITHLKYDVTNLAYFLRPSGGACIIGAGGGKDLQSALLFGHKNITGIDVNPIFIDLLETRYRNFAGLANDKNVRLVVDEARSYLTRTPEKYSLVQMSLIDTWASTTAGAFTLTENALYTVDAWQVFFKRVDDRGVFTVSRWYNPSDLGETGRLMSLAVESLFRFGIKDPSRHIAMATAGKISTLIISMAPLDGGDLDMLKKTCHEYQYRLIVAPGMVPESGALQKIMSARSSPEMHAAISGEVLNLTPTTDEDPYFFNMLKLDHLGAATTSSRGVLDGNLIAVITLICLVSGLLIIALITILIPLIWKSMKERKAVGSLNINWAGAAYFSLIGAGFMTLEIALIQKLSVFLGHPVYALGILLFTLILSTGVGSFLSDIVPILKSKWFMIYPLGTALIILGARFALPAMMANLITSPMHIKIVASIVALFPAGILLGFFFPAGMRLVEKESETQQPWFWALNGVFGVFTSAFAVFISINFGISKNFYIAMACYSLLPILMYRIYYSKMSRA